MASIEKITYIRRNGKPSTYWQVRYYDADGNRWSKNFDKHSLAYAEKVRVEGQILTGEHIPDSGSLTVAQAAKSYIEHFEGLVRSGKREKSTWKQYRGHINGHIAGSVIANTLLNTLQAKDCRLFLDALMKDISDVQCAKVMVTLRMVISYAEERGWIRGNPAKGVKVRKDTRKAKGLTIPEKSTVKALLDAASEAGAMEHALMCLGFFCGLRVSELRGLPRSAIRVGNVVVNQRADQWGKIGPPKTPKSSRVIPMGEYTSKAVKKWLQESSGDLLFPSGRGTPMVYQNLSNRVWKPLFKAAGIKPFGFHVMRHVCASLWIEQGYNPKQVQDMLGHATLAMTMDTYGHLFQDMKASRKMVNLAEKSVVGTK